MKKISLVILMFVGLVAGFASCSMPEVPTVSEKKEVITSAEVKKEPKKVEEPQDDKKPIVTDEQYQKILAGIKSDCENSGTRDWNKDIMDTQEAQRKEEEKQQQEWEDSHKRPLRR